MECIRCRREVPEGGMFCPWCGKRQAAAPPPQRRQRRRPKGSGSVYRLAGNRARPYIALTASKESLGTYATAGEAVQALDAYNAQRTPAARLRYTFEDVYQRWSAQHYQDVGPKGRESYERAFAKAESLYRREMRELRQEDYQAVVDALAGAGKSRSLCEKQRQLFSQMCQWAMKQDIITQNYASGLRLPGAAAKKERILTGAEIARIRACAENTDKGNRYCSIARLAMVLLYTGMRIDELLSMRRENVHLDQGYMIGGEKTSTGRNRIIPILEPVRGIIGGWMLDSLGTEWLLPTAAGRKRDVNTVEHSFRTLMNVCGINTEDTPKEARATPHTLRHTAATAMIEAGVAPTAVQAILGHKDFTTTANIYTSHNDPQYLLQEMQKIAL